MSVSSLGGVDGRLDVLVAAAREELGVALPRGEVALGLEMRGARGGRQPLR